MDNELVIEGFIRKINKTERDKIMSYFEDSKKLSYLCEFGVVMFDESEYVIEECENGDVYFATINMLERGKDGLFVILKHNVDEQVDVDKIPCFDDIFKVMKL